MPPQRQQRHSHSQASTASLAGDDVSDMYANLDEVIDIPPVQNPDEEPTYRSQALEQLQSQQQQLAREQRPRLRKARHEVCRLETQLYTVSYLILFSILGTLARLGLQALTTYPGTPVIFPSIWPNFVGSLVMGFLSEERIFFRDEQDAPLPSPSPQDRGSDEENHNTAAAKQAWAARKKTIPLYIGLTTGFCGSLTSFSAFIRDTFLALSNNLPAGSPSAPRNGGYSLLATLAVPALTVSLSLAALFFGAHLALALARFAVPSPSRSRSNKTRYLLFLLLDRATVPLACACWLAAALLSVFPPPGHAAWRGQATLAAALAPPGCLLRFVAAVRLNGRVVGFPVGTFAVNVAGTAVLAVAWALAHVKGVVGGNGGGEGAVVACQVLSGVQDGFSGCLTTVSTWVAELAVLRRRHAYVYGGMSVLAGLAVMVAVAGGARWSGRFDAAVCG